MIDRKLAALCGTVAVAVLGAAAPFAADAQGRGGSPSMFGHGRFPGGDWPGGPYPPAPSILRNMPLGAYDRELPDLPVARYSAGVSAFVLDRSGGLALLKFEDSPEVWVLEPTPAPRGDIIYRNDMGEPMLRATRLGGLTLFTPTAPGGAPAAMIGSGEALLPADGLPPSAMLQHMIQASLRASRAAQHSVSFDAPEINNQTAPVFADAATVAAEAVVLMSRREDGRAVLHHLNKMVFLPGHAPAAELQGGVMQIVVDPSRGMAGRPSSERLLRAALGK